MKNAKQYFLYLLKSNLRALIIISLCVIVLGVLISSTFVFEYKTYYNDELQRFVDVDDYMPNGYYYDGGIKRPCPSPSRVVYYRNTHLMYPAVMLMITSMFVPIWMFAHTKKRKNLDCFYSLPISRRSFALTHYLVGLIMTFAPFLLSYVTVLVTYLIKDMQKFVNLDFSMIFLHFLFCVLMGLVIYTILVFIFNEANSVFDGCVFIVTYLIYPMVWLSLISALLDINTPLDEVYAIPQVLFGDIIGELGEKIELFGLAHFSMANDPEWVKWLVIYTVLAVAAFIGFHYRSGSKKAENAENVSDTPFGYKTLIPLMAIPVGLYSDVIGSLFILITALIGYTIYRRGVRYKKSDYAVLAILGALVII